MKITFNDDSFIEVTPEHPIMNQIWKPAKSLQENMLVNNKSIKQIKQIKKG